MTNPKQNIENTFQEFTLILVALLKRGYENDIAKILGGKLMRVFYEVVE